MIPVLFITANVGSVFEDPESMLKIWMAEFFGVIERLQPHFIALHCQEVGGKNYEQSMKFVQEFIDMLLESLQEFNSVRIFIDEDYSTLESFTALGNLYFIHSSLKDVKIWDFEDNEFLPVDGKEIHRGSLEGVALKEKSKFPVDYFPECKWSRKGFVRTRWSLCNTKFDLVNIHLFHDASNFVAVESFPSVYTNNRRRALEHVLERFHKDSYDNLPLFLFGDFNFRLDTQGVVQSLTKGLVPIQTQEGKKKNDAFIQYKDESDKVIMTLGNKEFTHISSSDVYLEDGGKWLEDYDREMEVFSEKLFEFSRTFPPSYPYEENLQYPERYMPTRCPAWCDRVVLSLPACSLITSKSGESECKNKEDSVEYGIVGANVCMGDHKPVYLRCDLKTDAGIMPCFIDGVLTSSAPDLRSRNPRIHRTIERSHSELSERLKNVHCLQREMSDSYLEKEKPPMATAVVQPVLNTIMSHMSLRNMLLIKLNKQSCEKSSSLPLDLRGSRTPSPRSLKRHNSASIAEDIQQCHNDCNSADELHGKLKCALCEALEYELHGLERRGSFGSKGRFRLHRASHSVRSRYQSHHSSSEEEWFEEVDSEVDTHERLTLPLSDGSDTGFSEGAAVSPDKSDCSIWSSSKSHEHNSLLAEKVEAVEDEGKGVARRPSESHSCSRWLGCIPSCSKKHSRGQQNQCCTIS